MKKRLLRSRNDKMICGVCSGIANYFDIDPTLIRLGAVIVGICSIGLGVVGYFAAAIIMPEE